MKEFLIFGAVFLGLMAPDLLVAKEIKYSGSKDLTENVNEDAVTIDYSGSGDLTVKGQAKRVVVERASGSGHLDLKDLRAKTVEISYSGSSRVDLYASESFAIEASGSGDIYLHGEGVAKKEKNTGSGLIRRK